MNRPRIIVCVATFNQHSLIEACVHSILGQTVDADIRILVGDDASTDGTSDIMAKLESTDTKRIKLLRRKMNLGPCTNMCELITLADGDYIARVDGDDYWLQGKLQRQLEFLQAHPDCAAVYTNAITVDEANREIGLFNDVGDARLDLAAMLRQGNFLNNSSVLFRVANKQGWVEPSQQLDYQVHLWQARHGWLGHIGEPLTAYRVNTQGSMVAGMNDQVRELYWQAIQSVPRDRVSDDDYAHGIADFLRRVFFRAVRTRDMSLYRTWATRVYAASPYGRAHTSALVAASIFRIGGKALWGQRARLMGRRPPKILYRR